MEIYTIKQGIMRPVPEDYQLKQMAKYILLTIFGLIIGHLIAAV